MNETQLFEFSELWEEFANQPKFVPDLGFEDEHALFQHYFDEEVRTELEAFFDNREAAAALLGERRPCAGMAEAELRAAAQQGVADAQYALAVNCTRRDHEESRPSIEAAMAEAHYWLREAADQDHGDALCALGVLTALGRGVNADVEKALDLWKQAAECGSFEAFDYRDLVVNLRASACNDFQRPIEEFLGAEMEGMHECRWNLIPYYREDFGIEEARQALAGCYVELSQFGFGSAEACALVGAMALTGFGISEDRELGLEMFPFHEIASDDTDGEDASEFVRTEIVECISQLGEKFFKEFDHPNVRQAAIDLWIVAAEAGHAEACQSLAKAYFYGKVVTRNRGSAESWARRAAERGAKHGEALLGAILLESTASDSGDDLRSKRGEALAWLDRAVEKGDGKGKVVLGDIAWSEGRQEEALALYEQAAADDTDSACYRLAAIHLPDEWEYEHADETKGLAYLQRGVELGWSHCLSQMARLKVIGKSVEQDFDGARELLERAMKDGNGQAAGILGWLHDHGAFHDSSGKLAWDCYEKAVDWGEDSVLYERAILDLTGRAPEPDSLRGAARLREAAAKGSEIAQLRLGESFLTPDIDVPGFYFDPAQGRRWYRQAALQGSEEAMVTLGWLVYGGDGGVADPAQAFHLWKLAAEAGSAQAHCLLGMVYEAGIDGVLEPDSVKARHHYAIAAEEGVCFACTMLGSMWVTGEGGECDTGEGIRLLTEAAEEGDAKAMGRLGYTLLGVADGSTAIEKEGLRWLRRAIQAGDNPAMAYLAEAYDQGVGVKEDAAKCVHWLKKAADAGVPDAAVPLARAYYYGEGIEADPQKAMEILRMGAEDGDAAAQFSYGLLLGQENDDLETQAEAAAWIYHSRENGCEDAVEVIEEIENDLSLADRRLVEESLVDLRERLGGATQCG